MCHFVILISDLKRFFSPCFGVFTVYIVSEWYGKVLPSFQTISWCLSPNRVCVCLGRFWYMLQENCHAWHLSSSSLPPCRTSSHTAPWSPLPRWAWWQCLPSNPCWELHGILICIFYIYHILTVGNLSCPAAWIAAASFPFRIVRMWPVRQVELIRKDQFISFVVDFFCPLPSWRWKTEW